MSTRRTGPLLVGIDCGTQSAKVVVYDAAGTIVAAAQQPLRAMTHPTAGAAVHPDDDLWDAVGAASRAAVAAVGDGGAEIVGVGLCAVRCCKAFLDADGLLVEPIMSWMDARAYQPVVPDVPSLRFATTASGYLGHRLTGELRDAAANNIPMQWPTDAATWDWHRDDEVIASFGLRRDMLLALCAPGDVLGRMTPAAAAATGLPVGVPVVSTANDKAVEMLGTGSVDSSTVLLSLGTYIAAMVHGDDATTPATSYWTNFSSVPGRYLHESVGIRRGMWTVSWFLDLLGPEFAAAARAEGITREAYLEREAQLVPPGSDGVIAVLDWLAPSDAEFRKGSLLGFDERHTRAHVHRALLEAVALTMRRHVRAMVDELGAALDHVVVSGGGASSALTMQIIADVFGLPASRSVDGGGASRGAAMCAAVATGLHADIESAARSMSSPRETFHPDAGRHVLYTRLADEVYDHVRDATDRIYRPLFPLFT